MLNIITIINVQCCFTSAESVRTIRDGEPRTTTSTFTQLMNSGIVINAIHRSFIALFSALEHTHPAWHILLRARWAIFVFS